MSTNAYAVRVAKRTAYAKSLLRLTATVEGDALASSALCESALLHLHLAYLAFLREVGAGYQLRDFDGLDSAVALVKALREEGKSSGEASELSDLEADSDSWLSRLLHLAHPAEAPQAAFVPREGLIQAMAVGNARDGAHADVAWELLTAFLELVDRQRESLMEY